MFIVRLDFQNIDNIDSKLDKAFQDGLEEIGENIVRGAQSDVHVITGELRDSIQVTDRGHNYVVVSATAEYAADEEFGNARRPPHSFMGPQADRMQSEAPRIIQQKINQVL